MTIKISNQGSAGVAGVEAFGIEGAQYSWPHVGWAEKIIRHNGTAYLAAAILAAATGESTSMAAYGHKAIKFGPGGRRLYVAITERLIDQINSANAGYIEHARTAEQRERAAELVDFAVALIDLV